MDTSLKSNRREENQPDEQGDGPLKIHSQQGFGSKPKKRKKSEPTGIHGPRIIRSDRHSKVCTAGGTRDRRVRLAPKTAIQFYDVQDRLGCDRPSKAIDWLMSEAKAAIDALQDLPPPPDAANSSDRPNCTDAFVNSQPPENFGFLTNSSDQFQVYSDPGSFAWNYGNSPPPVFGQSQVLQFSPREPLQSSFSGISNYNPIGVELPNEDFTSGENRETDTIQFNSASFLHYEE